MLDAIKPSSLARKLKQFQIEWIKKTPKQKWQVVFGFGAKVTMTFGVRAFTDMKIDLFSYFVGAVISTYGVLVSYTMCYFFGQGEFMKGIECTYTAGIVTVVCTLDFMARKISTTFHLCMSHFCEHKTTFVIFLDFFGILQDHRTTTLQIYQHNKSWRQIFV